MSDDAATDRPVRSAEEREAFVRAHGAWGAPPLVPEVRLHLASEVTPLWHATEAWLAARGVPPPFWAFAWAGGQALARYLLDHPSTVRGLRVVDFASGSGLVAIAAMKAGAAEAAAIDVDPFAAAATRVNAAENGVQLTVTTDDVVGRALDADVILAGDVWYEQAAAARFSAWLRDRARGGTRVLFGDPERAYVPVAGTRRLATYAVPTPLDLEGRVVRQTNVAELLARELEGSA